MTKRSQTILSVVIVSLILILTVTATYAFFAANVTGTDASTSVYFATANQGITITFEGGNSETLSNIYPREEAWLEKDITIRSTAIASDIPSVYTFNIVVDENTYYDGDIKYTFINKEATGVEVGYTQTSDLTNLVSKTDIAHGYVKATNAATITYTLKVFYVNIDGRNQNTGSSERARFYITYTWGRAINLTVNLDGGQGLSDMQVAENSSITLPEPTKDGHRFVGWEVNGGTLSGNQLTVTNSDVSIKALWETLAPPVRTLNDDDWATIAYHVKNRTGDAAPYNVGDTKTFTLQGSNSQLNGKQVTVRVANNSNYNCTLESKSACGFVLEFVDIVSLGRMNASWSNVGGWPGSELYGLVNSTSNNQSIINALPSDLRLVIADTTVVSSHGSTSGETNFVSTDKLYLLSTREIHLDCVGGNNNWSSCNDYSSADGITRQLDYYYNGGVDPTTKDNYSRAIKNYNGSPEWWWLRTASSGYPNYFIVMSDEGEFGNDDANRANNGIAPAFRIIDK